MVHTTRHFEDPLHGFFGAVDVPFREIASQCCLSPADTSSHLQQCGQDFSLSPRRTARAKRRGFVVILPRFKLSRIHSLILPVILTILPDVLPSTSCRCANTIVPGIPLSTISFLSQSRRIPTQSCTPLTPSPPPQTLLPGTLYINYSILACRPLSRSFTT